MVLDLFFLMGKEFPVVKKAYAGQTSSKVGITISFRDTELFFACQSKN